MPPRLYASGQASGHQSTWRVSNRGHGERSVYLISRTPFEKAFVSTKLTTHYVIVLVKVKHMCSNFCKAERLFRKKWIGDGTGPEEGSYLRPTDFRITQLQAESNEKEEDCREWHRIADKSAARTTVASASSPRINHLCKKNTVHTAHV